MKKKFTQNGSGRIRKALLRQGKGSGWDIENTRREREGGRIKVSTYLCNNYLYQSIYVCTGRAMAC